MVARYGAVVNAPSADFRGCGNAASTGRAYAAGRGIVMPQSTQRRSRRLIEDLRRLFVGHAPKQQDQDDTPVIDEEKEEFTSALRHLTLHAEEIEKRWASIARVRQEREQ